MKSSRTVRRTVRQMTFLPPRRAMFMNSSRTVRRIVRQMTFFASRQTLFLNSSRIARRTIRQQTFFASPANIVHEQFANSSANCSPKPLFVQSGEHYSWTVCEWFAVLFARVTFSHNLANCSRTIIKLFANKLVWKEYNIFFSIVGVTRRRKLLNCLHGTRMSPFSFSSLPMALAGFSWT